jgi:hypothetical protein
MESTHDSLYKQFAVVEFLVAEKETVRNIRKWLGNVCGHAAFNRSIVGRWAKRVGDGEVGKAQLLGVPCSS